MISLVVFWCSVELDFKLQEDKLQPLMKRLCPTTDVHFAPLPYPQEAFTSTPKRKSKADSKKHARWKLWFLWEPLTTLTPWGWRRIQAFGHLQLMSYQTRLDLKDLDTKIEGGLLGVPPCWKLQNVTETKNEVVFFLQERKKSPKHKSGDQRRERTDFISCCLFIILAGPVPWWRPGVCHRFLLYQSGHRLSS